MQHIVSYKMMQYAVSAKSFENMQELNVEQ